MVEDSGDAKKTEVVRIMSMNFLDGFMYMIHMILLVERISRDKS
jgi:hypothetical protein